MKKSSTKEELINKIKTMNPALRIWEIWEALMSVFACSLANTCEPDVNVRNDREKEFERAVNVIGDRKVVAETFALLMKVIDEEPCQDILGDIYMKLNLGGHWKGQYFTPSNVAELMSQITISREEASEQIKEQGYISLTDPCVGAGVMLLAGAKRIRDMGFDYHSQVLYVGQDVDKIVAQMAYIQLSLNGLYGYVCVGDSLRNPIAVDEDGNLLKQPGQDFWFTPRYQLDKLMNILEKAS